MKHSHPSDAELAEFAFHGLHICEHLKVCDACRASMFSSPTIRANARRFDADPPWILTIDGTTIAAGDSDQAAPLVAEAWRTKKSINCRLATDDPAVDRSSAVLGLAARVNRILEAEGWDGPWWVPTHV